MLRFTQLVPVAYVLYDNSLMKPMLVTPQIALCSPLSGRGLRLRIPGLLQWLKSVTSTGTGDMRTVVYDQGHNIPQLASSFLCQVLLNF